MLGYTLTSARSALAGPRSAGGSACRGLLPTLTPRGGAALITAAGAVAAATRSVQRSAQVRRAASLGGKFDVSQYYAKKPDEVTKDWVMQQTMYRIKDPKRSLDFYTNVLGMSLLATGDFPQWGFTVYFVGYPPKDFGPVPTDDAEKFAYCMKVPGCIELTWNHGSEVEDGERVYNTGNSDSMGSTDGEKVKGGFGHIGLSVPDVYEACQRFKDMGAEFTKSPNSGGMAGLAFVKDPDGYLVEIVPYGKSFPFPTKEVDCCGVELNQGPGYKDNSK